ncbi:30S ribosomal protein S2 [Candidatus Wolfebacteria bacterium]|nr:MAG: 30S ribosomal protein S2 [Candidatus Wolfebacteria bacterium]
MTEIDKQAALKEMFEAGTHFAYARSRRHPSVAPFIFGAKNRIEIFDLEKTYDTLATTKEYVKGLGKEGKVILFVAGKNEAHDALVKGAESIEMPHVAGRWIGGTLTNFTQIKKRIDKLADLKEKKEKGSLAQFTKKERLLIDRDIEDLERTFGGITTLAKKPDALFVVDPRQEIIAVKEADVIGIPVIAIMGSDCNIKEVSQAIVGNDSARGSISYFIDQLSAAYLEGKAEKQAETVEAAKVAPTDKSDKSDK